MSLSQSGVVVRLLRSRALLRSVGPRAPRSTSNSGSWRRDRLDWLSTLRQGQRWETSVVSVEPLETTAEHDEKDGSTTAADKKDRMLDAVHEAIHGNVERILGAKPELHAKWKRIVRERQKEQQSFSRAQTIVARRTGKNPANALHPSSESSTNGGKDGVHPMKQDLKRRVDASGGASSWRSAGNEDMQLVEDETILEDTTLERFHTVQDSPSSGLSESRESERQSFLDLLHQPLEESEGISERDAIVASSTLSKPSSLLDLLGDDEADFVSNGIRDNASHESSSLTNSPRLVEDSATSSESLRARPASLLELIDDDEVESEADVGTRDRHVATCQLPNAPPSLPDTREAVHAQPTSLLDLLVDDKVELDAVRTTADRGYLERPTGLHPSLVDVIDDDVEAKPLQSDFGGRIKRTFKASQPSPLPITKQDSIEHNSGVLLDEREEEEVPGAGNVWPNDKSSGRATNLFIDDATRLSPTDATETGLALLLAMSDSDWSQLNADDEVNPAEKEEIEGMPLESDFEEEMIVETEQETGRCVDDIILQSTADLLEGASFAKISLSSSDCNALLLQLATSRLQLDEVIATMLKIYVHMSELARSGSSCAPDATTYAILMVTLDRRASAPISAADLCKQMIDGQVELSSESLTQGLRCLKRQNCVTHAERLMYMALANEAGNLPIPQWAWVSVLEMYKGENMQQEALDLLQRCVERGDNDFSTVTNLFMHSITWPRQDRRGRRLDRSSFLAQILVMLESCSTPPEKLADSSFRGASITDDWLGIIEERHCGPRGNNMLITTSYTPPYKVWRRLILSLVGEVDRKTNTGWEIVHRGFKSMRNSIESYWPDSLLLKSGLTTAEATGDAKLAVDLVLKLQDRQPYETIEARQPDATREIESSLFLSDAAAGDDIDTDVHTSEPTHSHTSIKEDDLSVPEEGNESEIPQGEVHADFGLPSLSVTESSERVRVPLQAFISAMRVCIVTNDLRSTERLLDGLRDPRNRIPTSFKRDLFSLALKGYAKAGNSKGAQDLLREMQDGELQPSEEAYGTVIYSLVVAKKPKEACALFDVIQSGRFNDGGAPGLTCYNSRMLAHIEAHEWEEALECHRARKEAGLPWSSANFQDVLLASFRLGNKEKALETIEEALGSGLKIDYGVFDLSMTILLGDMLKSNITRIDDVRKRLRELGEENEDLKHVSLNLSRALRSAEVEQKRRPTNGLRSNEVSSRRESAWKGALQNLVTLTRAIEKDQDSKASLSNY